MKRILKYTLNVTDEQKIQTFKGFRPLSVQIQRGALCLWMLIDENAPQCKAEISIFGTGHPFYGDNLEYVGSAQTHDGNLIWHVFINMNGLE